VLSWVKTATELLYWTGRTDFPLTDTGVFDEWHQDPDIHAFMMFVGDDLIGYGECWYDDSDQSVELARLIIKPEQRRNGHGSQLVKLLLQPANQMHPHDIWMRVHPDNQRAESVYLNAGFKRADEEKETAFNHGEKANFHWLHCSPKI